MDAKLRIKVFGLIVLLACCWGPSFLFIKLAVGEIPPLTLVTCRLALGGLLLWGILRIQGERLWPYRRHLQHFVVMGIFACGLPFFLISFGEMFIPSSLAAIINSTTPICTAILAHFFVASERINLNKGVGILVGFAGILIVFMPSLFSHADGNEFGAFLVFLAAISYAIGMVYSKKHFQGIPPFVGATAQLFAGTLMLLPFSLLMEQPFDLPSPSLTAIGGLCGLAVLGTATAFPVFYTVVKLAGATALSTSTLLFPVIGVFLGVVVLGESVGINAYIGSAMILCGLAVANGLVRFDKAISRFSRRSES